MSPHDSSFIYQDETQPFLWNNFFNWLDIHWYDVRNLYVQIFDLFDVKRKGVVDFDDFVRSLNVFHPNAALEDNIECELKIESSTYCCLP